MLRYPPVSVEKLHRRETLDTIRRQLLNPGPFHAQRLWRGRPSVVELRVEKSLEGKRPVPRHPPVGMDEVVEERLHYDGPRVLLPRPAQIRLDLVLDRLKLSIGFECAVLDHQRRRLPHI